MPRTARASQANVCYHVLNRGNRRAEVSHHDGDYAAFVRVLRQACARVPMRVLAYCLMPNHFHLVVWPLGEGDLSDWMQWLLTAHVRRYQRLYHTTGHVWQGRFKAFPIQEDEHYYGVARYVERNAQRANLVRRAEQWRWGSLFRWQRGSAEDRILLAPWPLPRQANWVEHVNEPQTEGELAAIRRSVLRGVPYGDDAWTTRAVQDLGLETTLRPRGRPRKAEKGS